MKTQLILLAVVLSVASVSLGATKQWEYSITNNASILILPFYADGKGCCVFRAIFSPNGPGTSWRIVWLDKKGMPIYVREFSSETYLGVSIAYVSNKRICFTATTSGYSNETYTVTSKGDEQIMVTDTGYSYYQNMMSSGRDYGDKSGMFVVRNPEPQGNTYIASVKRYTYK